MKSEITDTQRLDWIEKQTDGSFWVARKSTKLHSFRLYNAPHNYIHTSDYRESVRAAIDAAMKIEEESKS